MTVEALFFDLDGVLWDSETAALRSWQETFAAFGVQMPFEVFESMLGTVGGRDPLDELERLLGHPVDRAKVTAKRWQRKMALVRQLGPRPGVIDYLRSARERGLSLAVVSTDDLEWITTGLKILGLLDAWDFIECAGGEESRAKPSPALYLAAVQRLGLAPWQAVAIEDSPNGIRAAKDAGLFCLCVANEVTRPLDLSAADLIVDSLEGVSLDDLVEAAESWAGRSRLELPTDVPGLVLRRLSEHDAKVYYDLIDRNRDHLTAHGDYQEMRHATLQSVLHDLAGPPEDNIAFGVRLGDSLIGRVDLVPREAGNFVLGFWLDQEHTGHGYATAACTTLIEFGRSVLQATDIWAGVTKGNVPSESVLERLGFERVGDMGSYTRFHRSLGA